MLEVKQLKKIYKPKKGTIVNALDGVYLQFPEKGMIFILGKSGSGKSTLLNLLGGLDTYDEGEIIIKGKSSKDFSQSEFDSYRNTYLGFIFQSYNILDEFSVADNIALAIELQHEKATKERINEILIQVDLEGFGNRKPRELSGGQKQRVAIARALVKNPEIILADEPTGALDSTTGIAVFDTLKALSKDKLVIIVSHDREFAENYGDRVIEFKDGQVISDIIKYPIENIEINDSIQLYDNQAFKIKKGYQLTVKDLEEINKQISISNEDVYISLNKRTSEATKTAARITEDGSSEAFRDTKKEDITTNNDDVFKLKKSRLGIKNSFRIGASSLKVKPARLVITIILAICAFTLFGIADTMGSYDGASVTYNSFIDSNVTHSSIKKYQITNSGWEREVDVTQTDVDYFKNEFGLETIHVYDTNLHLSNYLIDTPSAPYYQVSFNYGVVLTNDNINKLNLNLTGNLPENENEIVITNYMYEYFELGGYAYNNDNERIEKDIENHNDIIGLYLGNYKIVGVLDTLLDSSKYDDLKQTDQDNWFAGYMFQSSMACELHSMAIYHEDKFSDFEIPNYLETNFDITINKTDISAELQWGNKFFSYENQYINFFDSNKTSLNDDEIIISYHSLYNLYWEKFNEINPDDKRTLISSYVEDNTYLEIWKEDGWEYIGWGENYWNQIDDDTYKYYWIEYLLGNGFEQNSFDPTYPSGLDICFDLYIDAASLSSFLTSSINIYDLDETKDFKIVGVSTQMNYEEIITSSNYYSILEDSLPASGYSQVIVIFPNDLTVLKSLVNYIYEKDDYTFDFKCSVQSTISMANNFIEQTTSIFLYIGIFFAAFSSLLLFNFISVSISYKQKEIGILRAIGARSKDVFGIFFSETLIIGFINFAVSCIAVFIVCNFINTYLREDIGVAMSLLNPNIRQIVLIFAVSLLVSFISSFFPVYKIAIKRPIESIRQG